MVCPRKITSALLFSSVLLTTGCCYHAQNFGRARDIGWGEIGCSTCRATTNCCPNSCAKATCCEPGCAPALTKEPPTGNSSFSVAIREPGRSALGLTRESAETRNANKASANLPIYVLPAECIANGVIVNPNPVQAAAPTAASTAASTVAPTVAPPVAPTLRTAREVPIRETADGNN